MIDTSWNPPAGGWSMEPQPVILPAANSPALTPLEEPAYRHVPRLESEDAETEQEYLREEEGINESGD